jgi:hypothetical protein
MRLSLARPPWIGNCVVTVPAAGSFTLVSTPGTIITMDP